MVRIKNSRMVTPKIYRKDLDKSQWSSYINYMKDLGTDSCFFLDYVYDVFVGELEKNILTESGKNYVQAYEDAFNVDDRYRYGTMH